METIIELDLERVEFLVTLLMGVIKRDYLGKKPISKRRVFEALNALAVTSALIIQGADGPDGDAHTFFNERCSILLKSDPR